MLKPLSTHQTMPHICVCCTFPANASILVPCPKPTSVTYLQVFLDYKLDFLVERVFSSLSSGIFLLRRLSCFASGDLLIMVAFTLYFLPSFYMWNAGPPKLKRLFRLQQRAVRVVFRLKGSQTCRYVFRNNTFLNFPSIYILE